MAPASIKAKFLAVAFSASPDAQAPAWPNWKKTFKITFLMLVVGDKIYMAIMYIAVQSLLFII